jgi:hypothetical protein
VQQVFVVTLARSGSTLLRYLLDAHPDVTAPPELNLSALLHHSADTWHRTLDAVIDRPADEATGVEQAYSPEAYQRARRAVDPIMLRCANIAGASVFCDKSLTTVDHLNTVSRCYPRASFIMLYRYPLDMIASGIEASKWGFNAFGFAPYVGSTPGNFVASLGNYWIDRVSKMLEFERTTEVARARIYYELLCDDPSTTMSQLLEFLDLEADDGLIERTFDSDHGRGPGDYKIDYTGSVNFESIGRGSRLPHNLMAGQVERIDELLAELDYPSLDSVWKGDLASLLGLKHVVDSRSMEQPDDLLASRIAEIVKRGVAAVSADRLECLLPLEIVVHGRTGDESRIGVDSSGDVTTSGLVGESKPVRVHCQEDILLKVSVGEINLAQATQDGAVRIELDPETNRRRGAQLMKALAALVRAGSNDPP